MEEYAYFHWLDSGQQSAQIERHANDRNRNGRELRERYRAS